MRIDRSTSLRLILVALLLVLGVAAGFALSDSVGAEFRACLDRGDRGYGENVHAYAVELDAAREFGLEIPDGAEEVTIADGATRVVAVRSGGRTTHVLSFDRAPGGWYLDRFFVC